MKNVLKNSIISLAAGATILTSFSGQALAAGQESTCQTVYGGGQVCEVVTRFTLDKKIQSPTKGGQFVDNIGQGESTFAPGQQVNFQIVVQNTGEETIEGLDVADILPEELEFVSGPGEYNTDNRTIAYTIDRLEPGESNEQTFAARVVGEDALPSNEALMCASNAARAVAPNNSTAEDTSEFCIARQVPTKETPTVYQTPPVKETPSTGPEMLALIALVPAAASGIYLRKKSK